MVESHSKIDNIKKIPEQWELKKIIELCDEITDGSHFSPKEDLEGIYRIASVKDFSEYGFDTSSCKKISEKAFCDLIKNGCVPNYDDVLLSKDGTMGKVYVSRGEPIALLSSIAIIKPKKQICSKYLAYFLKDKHTQDELINNYSSGSALPRIVLKDLKELNVAIPKNVQEQRAIANILACLDSKIEISLEINNTLETIARMIFKHWFIDFEFPDENGKPYRSSGGKMVDSELGAIPEGWNVTELPQICRIVDCLHSKKPKKVDNSEKFLLQVYNIGKFNTLDLTEKFFVNEAEYTEWTRNIAVQEGDCIITNAGLTGAIAQIPFGFKGGIGRNLTCIRPLNIKPTYLLQYLLSSHGIKQISKNTDEGTIFSSLNVKGIRKMKVLIPQISVLNEYEKRARALRYKIEVSVIENSVLAVLRDILLPKLISGKIRVPVSNEASGSA